MPLTENKKASNAKWDAANLKRMSLAVPVELHERLTDHVGVTGESVNGFLKRAIDETITRDGIRFNYRDPADNTLTKMNQRESDLIADYESLAENGTITLIK